MRSFHMTCQSKFADTCRLTVPWQIRQQLHKERQKAIFVSNIFQPHKPPQAPSVMYDPIFLYVFSRRRRPGDYESQMQTLFERYPLKGRVLLLDLALSDLRNARHTTVVDRFLRWMTQGCIGSSPSMRDKVYGLRRGSSTRVIHVILA